MKTYFILLLLTVFYYITILSFMSDYNPGGGGVIIVDKYINKYLYLLITIMSYNAFIKCLYTTYKSNKRDLKVLPFMLIYQICLGYTDISFFVWN